MRLVYGSLIVLLSLFTVQSSAFALELFGQKLVFKGETFVVEIKEADVHSSPDMASPVISKLNFGDEIEIAETQKPWIKFEANGVSGWIHMSSGRTNFDLQANKSKHRVDVQERHLALAAKGYGADKDKNKQLNLNFTKNDLNRLNAMLKYSYTREQLIQFYSEGK